MGPEHDACELPDVVSDAAGLVLAAAHCDLEGMRAVLRYGCPSCTAVFLAHKIAQASGVAEAELEGPEHLDRLLGYLFPLWLDRARP